MNPTNPHGSLVLRLDDPEAESTSMAGGKGGSLARLTRRGFPVPRGFVVTTVAYGRWFALVQERLRDGPSRLPHEGGRHARIRKLGSTVPLEPALAEAAAGLIGELGPNTRFAVRSSSTLEDSAGAAFAGLHATWLNCGTAALLDRIRDCFLSLWSDAAITYRVQRGLNANPGAMAVVIQEMVPCDVAGVAFTANPVTGALDDVLVDANLGLGESVVTGDADGDHWRLGKASRDIRLSIVGAKLRHVVGADSGTVTIPTSVEDRNRPALTAQALDALVDLVLRVEADAGFPQDVEWGIAGGQIRILQSRPITTLPPRWTRDESAERFPTALTRLTWDFVDTAFHRSLVHSLRVMSMPPFDGRWFAVFDHYVYGNQTAVDLYAGRTPVAVDSLNDLRDRLPSIARKFAWVGELPGAWARDLDQYLVSVGEIGATRLDAASMGELWASLERIQHLGTEYFLPNIAISLTQANLFRFLHRILCLAVGETQAAARLQALTAACDTKTAAVNREVRELAAAIRRVPGLVARIQGHPSREFIESGQLDEDADVSRRFRSILRVHGHRETEFDPFHPPWIDAPWTLLDIVRPGLTSAEDPPPGEVEAGVRLRMVDAEREVYGRLPRELHFLFSEVLRLTRVYTALDDLEHYETTRLGLLLRRVVRELGTRLHRRDLIDDPMDLFMTDRAALRNALNRDCTEGWAELARAIRMEKTGYAEHRSMAPPWVAASLPCEPHSTRGGLEGIGASPGVAEGRAALVRSPADFAGFRRGSVLVAVTTNPAWTPLFSSAVAVVTECGGMLSHGAVTARELGIPAVVRVRGCLTDLVQGHRIRVDGDRGRIQRLD